VERRDMVVRRDKKQYVLGLDESNSDMKTQRMVKQLVEE
jgi:hypothetical protein